MIYTKKKLSALFRANARRLKTVRPLPPGSLNNAVSVDSFKLTTLQDLKKTYGPIYKMWFRTRVLICVDGQDLGAQLLREHSSTMRAPLLNYSLLFKGGALRGMEGEMHSHYRKILAEGIASVPVSRHAAELSAEVKQIINDIVATDGPVNGTVLREHGQRFSYRSIVLQFFGIRPDQPQYDELWELYRDYLMHELQRNISTEQKKVFDEIRTIVTSLPACTDPHSQEIPSQLAHFAGNDLLDETVLGNLILNVDAARGDIFGLFLWAIEELADHPDVLERIATCTSADEKKSLVRATVMEILRLHQATFILRQVTKSFTFSSFTFPRGAYVHFCNWEGHNDPENFADPRTFNLERFLNPEHDPSVFRPFGFGHHGCIAGRWAQAMLELFVSELADSAQIERVHRAEPTIRQVDFIPGNESATRWTHRRKA